jgi:hypothetical protein
MDNIFYIYRWIRLDTNTPFYVGKGKSNRFSQTKTGRNRYFRNILKLSNCEVEIIMSNLTEQQALEKEIEFIKLYKNLGYCEANLSMGGEGRGHGFKHTEEHKAKLSEMNRGSKNGFFGKTHSDEYKKRKSEELKGKSFSPATQFKKGHKSIHGFKKGLIPKNRRPLIDIVTGHIYESIRKASQQLNINLSTLLGYMCGERPNKTNLRYYNMEATN